MRKEDPPKKDRRRLINIYKSGGVPFEEDVAIRMGDTRLKQGPTWDPNTGQELWWTYIGDYWWCRKHGRKYDFARLLAVTYNDLEEREYDGLWDEKRHAPDEFPRIVYKDGQKGYVVEYNKFEILVQWEDEFGRRSLPTSCKTLDGLRFEFEEDEKKFSKLLGSRK
jgi:hypothetical protein